MNKIKHSFGDVGLSPSPDPTLILDYSPITNYIKERIALYDDELEPNSVVRELEGVLSKIEELERNEFEKIVQVNSKS